MKRGRRQPTRRAPASSEVVPFDVDLDHITLREEAIKRADSVREPYAGLLRLLRDCEYIPLGAAYHQQRKGATYKQLAAIGHSVGMSKAQRVRWYRLAEEIPLSRRCAGHILSRLKKEAA